jgi:hypothetical protein
MRATPEGTAKALKRLENDEGEYMLTQIAISGDEFTIDDLRAAEKQLWKTRRDLAWLRWRRRHDEEILLGGLKGCGFVILLVLFIGAMEIITYFWR